VAADGAAEDVVVVGGGAVGVCCAYALARAGRSVRLLERDRLCGGASWGNSGLVTTSACAPEAAPGVMGQALRWMLRGDSPFRMRPRLDPAFARWVWRFRGNCTAGAAAASTAYLRDRVRENVELVDAIARESPADFAWRREGLMALYATDAGFAEGRRGAAALRDLGVPSRELDPQAVAREEPGVNGPLVGGVLYPEDAHLDPGAFVAAIGDLARQHGARLDERAPVVRLSGAHRIEEVETATERIRPDLVVLANGAWAPKLARTLRLPLLVEPAKGFSLTYGAGGEVFRRPLRLWEIRTVVSSMGANVRVTSKLDLVGLDERVREGRIRRSGAQAGRYVALPPGIDGARAWAGLRPLTPDGLPLIGRAPRIGNLVLATGHGHLGISLAAVTGEAVAGIAQGDDPPFDARPLAPERFDA
jgi:D-amino-acid dehydrogenase